VRVGVNVVVLILAITVARKQAERDQQIGGTPAKDT
jgi:hypothetical protein